MPSGQFNTVVISVSDILPLDKGHYISVIKGDAKNYSIAAASIIAKVTRDKIMEEWDSVYPAYGFARHKGYGTAEHIRVIKEQGPCTIHRRTFIKNFVQEENI